MAEAEPGPSKINTRNSGVSSDVDQNTQKHGSKLERRKGATKARKNCGEKGNSVGEKERVSDSASGKKLKNRDHKKSVVEMAETGNSIAEKESDVGKQVISGGTSGEQILNPNDDDQSVDETSQTGNGVGETEGVSDGALLEPIINREANKSVLEMAETGNSIAEKESDVGKQVISGGTSGEQILNPNDDDQSVDETSQTANGVGETEGVSDGALLEPIINREANKSVVETAETGNSIGEKESDVGKQVMSGETSGEQILNPIDDDQSVDETSQTGNGVGETEGVSDGALPEPIINRDANKSVVEMAETGNSLGEKESDVGKQVMSGGTSGEQILNPYDNGQEVDETSQTANGVSETEGVSDGALAEPIINRDDNKSVDETAVNSLGEKESDAVKPVIISDGASGEPIRNPNDDDHSVDETTQTGSGLSEPEGVSDGALAEPIKNPHDNKSVDETAEIVNSVGEKESDAVKQVIINDGASGEPIPNAHDDDQSLDETSQTGNGLGETEEVSDGTLAEPIKNRDDNKSADETAEKGNNNRAQEESDALKQVIINDGASGQHITNSDDAKSPDETAEMANGICEKTVEIEGDVKQAITYDGESGEQTKNRDDHGVITGENIYESKANLDKATRKSMETEMKDTEILFSDVENEIDEDTELTDIINNLAEEIIETLAEETVSKYYALEINQEREEAQCLNPPLESAQNLSKVLSSDVESGDEEDNLSLAKLKALNKLKETLRETTPMSMEEYRLRNQEELDAKRIHKKCVQAVTAPSLSDTGASLPSDSEVASTFDTTQSNSDGPDQEQSTASTGLKSDTTFSNGMESDSSEEWTIITRKKKKGKKSHK